MFVFYNCPHPLKPLLDMQLSINLVKNQIVCVTSILTFMSRHVEHNNFYVRTAHSPNTKEACALLVGLYLTYSLLFREICQSTLLKKSFLSSIAFLTITWFSFFSQHLARTAAAASSLASLTH